MSKFSIPDRSFSILWINILKFNGCLPAYIFPMEQVDSFGTSVLYLTFSVALADGVRVHAEEQVINMILQHEDISEAVYQKFLKDSDQLSVEEMRQIGIEAIKDSEENDKLRVYGWVYKVIEVDGMVDIREAKFLLYALRDSNIELDDVIQTSKELPRL